MQPIVDGTRNGLHRLSLKKYKYEGDLVPAWFLPTRRDFMRNRVEYWFIPIALIVAPLHIVGAALRALWLEVLEVITLWEKHNAQKEEGREEVRSSTLR